MLTRKELHLSCLKHFMRTFFISLVTAIIDNTLNRWTLLFRGKKRLFFRHAHRWIQADRVIVIAFHCETRSSRYCGESSQVEICKRLHYHHTLESLLIKAKCAFTPATVITCTLI